MCIFIIKFNKLVFLTLYAKCSSAACGFLADLNLGSPQGMHFLQQILMKIDISLRLVLIWICIDLVFIILHKKLSLAECLKNAGGGWFPGGGWGGGKV